MKNKNKSVSAVIVLIFTLLSFCYQFKFSASLPDSYTYSEYICYALLGVWIVILYHHVVGNNAKYWLKVLAAITSAGLYTTFVFILNNLWRAMSWKGAFGWGVKEHFQWLSSMDLTYHIGLGGLRYPLVFVGMTIFLLQFRRIAAALLTMKNREKNN